MDENINESKRKDHLKALYWSFLLDAIMIVIAVGSFLLHVELAEKIISICAAVIAISFTVFLAIYYHRKFVIPSKTDKPFEDIRTSVYARRKGKNMFEICDNIKKQHRRNIIFAMFLCSICVFGISYLAPKLQNIDIPLWAVVLIFIAIMTISMLLGFKKDYSFIDSKELIQKINDKGLDPNDVNNDFMHGTYHNTKHGILTIGIDYYVFFTKNLCYVGKLKDVIKVVPLKRIIDKKKNTFVLCINIYEEDYYYTLPIGDNKQVEMILYEFLKRGVHTENKAIEEDFKTNK